MTAATSHICPHCHGTGVIEPPKPKARGNALGPLPPYGREVEHAAQAGCMPTLGVSLFFRPEPKSEARPGPHPDVWAMAKAANAERPGSAMVLPSGGNVSHFRWPAIPRTRFGSQIAFWAYDCTDEERDAIGRALIESGYDRVAALGGAGCPVTYESNTPWDG